MLGTILITGGNATVRNTTKADPNTAKLLKIIAAFPNAKCHLRRLDLSRMEEVSNFAETIRDDIGNGRIPNLVSIICNAMTWSLSSGLKLTPVDEIEMSLAVNHLAHFNLVLRLLGDLKDAKDGRVIFLGSDAHENPGFGGLKPELPENLEKLAHPPPDRKGEEAAKGFYRYGVSKLVVIMTAYEMERRVRENPDFENVSIMTVDPGGLLDSRAFGQSDVPRLWGMTISILGLLHPVLKYVLPQLRFTATAAADVIDLAVLEKYKGKGGYYLMNKPGESNRDSRDEKVQRALWEKSIEWCGLDQNVSVLPLY